MNIVHISTYDISGGAARAAYRLHHGLRQAGHESLMLVRQKVSSDETILRASKEMSADAVAADFYSGAVIQQHYINSHRTDISNTLFSLPAPGIDIATHPAVRDADIINLHWVAGYQSPVSLQRLFSSGKPVVWTLHDQWPFTGGCHYAAGCAKYADTCSPCPQLAEDPVGLPAAVLQDRRDAYQDAPLTVVTPSRWLAARAKESLVFRDKRIETIPNGVETDVYSPISRGRARKNLGLDASGIVLLFGSEYGGEKRKGSHELLVALRYCLSSIGSTHAVVKDKIIAICYGHLSQELQTAGLPITSLGYLRSDEQIRDAYCAADMFILPSLEDNLPNTMLESMSCGTPVIAFAVGGIPDVIADEQTGISVPRGDAEALGKAIAALSANRQQREHIGRNGRALMVERYSLEHQARNYAALYDDLIKERASGSRVYVPRGTGIEELDGRSETDALGTHVDKIYDQLLYRSLKEYAIETSQQLKVIEADRAARLEAVHNLEATLRESEADRAARLEAIHNLEALLQESEADRAARLETIHNLEALLQESEADRAARLETVHNLEAVIDEQRKLIGALQQEIKTIKSSRIWKMAEALRLIRTKRDDVTGL
jgi:glycosyltransferase involved in cell wall biosynthesis